MAKTDKPAPEEAAADPKMSLDPAVSGQDEQTAEPQESAGKSADDTVVDDRPLREDLPTNDEPDIPLTANAEEIYSQRAVVVPPVPAAPRVVEAPRLPDAEEAPLLRRLVTEDDLKSPGFNLLIGGARENFETMVLRPGDRVLGGVEVIGLHNINERIELRPGAVVPEGDTGYVPTNYIMDHQRQRMIHAQAEREVGNRKR
jgi:hypothetical protein